MITRRSTSRTPVFFQEPHLETESGGKAHITSILPKAELVVMASYALLDEAEEGETMPVKQPRSY